MSISNKSVSRINRAVKEQTSSDKPEPLASSKVIKETAPLKRNSAVSGITQKLPDYLL